MNKRTAERIAQGIVRDLQVNYRGGWALVGPSLRHALAEAQVLACVCRLDTAGKTGQDIIEAADKIREAVFALIYPEDAARLAEAGAVNMRLEPSPAMAAELMSLKDKP